MRYVCTVCKKGGASARGDIGPASYHCHHCGGKSTMLPVVDPKPEPKAAVAPVETRTAERTRNKRHAWVTGSKRSGYVIVMTLQAFEMDFDQLTQINWGVYRAAQDVANAVHDHVEKKLAGSK